MSWWGKVIGGAFGFMLSGPLGALLGAALGHTLDKGMHNLPDEEPGGPRSGTQQRIQSAFFTATFTVMGHLSKADGRVSEQEIAVARQVMAQMDLKASQKRAAMHLFNEGKQADFPLQAALEQLRRECGRRTNLLRMFLEIQIAVAWADGQCQAAEQRVLHHICRVIGVSQTEFERLEAMFRAETHHRSQGGKRGMHMSDACTILGISPDASERDVKKAYRRLLSQHHPDKLVSKGLPEEMMKIAAQKTHEIKQAYECICRERGF